MMGYRLVVLKVTFVKNFLDRYPRSSLEDIFTYTVQRMMT